MKKIGILYHPKLEAAYKLTEELQTFLVGRGVHVWLNSAWEPEKAEAQLDGTELLLTIGGDGTILRAAQLALQAGVPITGVNLGRLGFMTELRPDEARDGLTALLDGEGWLDERAMLEAEVSLPGEKAGPPYNALNDVVVARGAIARLIDTEVSIGSELFTRYRADGVILATATGSTGYSLAAGGPILYPQSHDFILMPILPHLHSGYPVVLSPAAPVRLAISTTHQATISVDGHVNLPLPSGTVITVKHSAKTTRFLRVRKDKSFYASLEQKLKGK